MIRRVKQYACWALLVAVLGCSGDKPEPTVEAAPASVTEMPAPASDVAAVEAAAEPELSSPDVDAQRNEEMGPPEALETRLERAWDQGSAEATRTALRWLLDAQESRRTDVLSQEALADWGKRLADRLLEWSELTLAHDETTTAQNSLPVLQRWQPENTRIQQLAMRLQQVKAQQAALQQIDQRITEGRWVDASQDNAVALLHALLETAPLHEGARLRLYKIESQLLEQAVDVARRGDFDQANAILAKAAKVRTGSNRTQDTAARIMEIREQYVAHWKTRILAALAQQNVAEAESLLPTLDAVALDERDGLQMRKEIERVRLYGEYDAGQVITDTLQRGGTAPELVVIPAGQFMMGSSRSEKNRQASEGKRHRVTFARGFALARTETTVAQFREFITATEYRTSAQRKRASMVYDERNGAMVERRRVTWSDNFIGKPANDEEPVMHVSWQDAQAYAQWLSEETGLPYRLPSEAEFEYALRAGSDSRYPWGDGVPDQVVENLTGGLDQSPAQRRWSNAFAKYDDGYWGPAPVAQFPANAFGINDINGNLSEWVEDCWHDSYSRAPVNGKAWVNPGCAQRVIRGASWASSPEQARSAYRTSAPVATVSARVGFRVARDLW